MTDSMVERVARAIYRASHGGEETRARELWPWPPHEEHISERYRDIARAAIAAMREPSNGMTTEGAIAVQDALPDAMVHATVRGPEVAANVAWRAMIDEILKE